jgi:hypothetical protein
MHKKVTKREGKNARTKEGNKKEHQSSQKGTYRNEVWVMAGCILTTAVTNDAKARQLANRCQEPNFSTTTLGLYCISAMLAGTYVKQTTQNILFCSFVL